MDIRDATPIDIPGITRIYNDAVLNTTAIWSEAEVDDANRTAWLEDRRKAAYPVLVSPSTAMEPSSATLRSATGGLGTGIGIRLSIRCMCTLTSAARASEPC